MAVTSRQVAWTLGSVAALEVLAASGLALAVDWTWQDALDTFVVSNCVMGLAFALCGALIALHLPGNAVGWLFVADGLGHATSALAAPVAQRLHDSGAAIGLQRAALAVLSWSWPWSIGLFLPVALLLFPDGRLPSPGWRPVLVGVSATAPLFVLEIGTGPDRLRPELPPAYLTWGGHDRLTALWTVSELRTSGALLLAVVALVVRYRSAGDVQRRQLLWLLLAAVVVLGAVVPWSFVAGTPVIVLFAIPLIPVAVTVAILRHGLLDIRIVVSRTLTWLLLTGAAVLAYVLLVALLDRFVTASVGRSAAATVLIALVVAPLLPRLQRRVDRIVFGDRGDPARVASRVGQRLQQGDGADLTAAAAAVRQALRLTYVSVVAGDQQLGADGAIDGPIQSISLDYAGAAVGELVVGLRRGERQLTDRDREVLTLVAAPLAVAVHATRLTHEVQASRERLVLAREEERRRIRRDLHDGLGPTLTGLSLTADAAANLVAVDPDGASDLLAGLRTDTRAALADVRTLVDDLRPAALDQVGLAEALRQRIDKVASQAQGLQVQLEAPEVMPPLPAAVEVAVYRIAIEALTNVVRHSGASRAVITLRAGDAVEIDVSDDGGGDSGWQPGVGLQAIHERAAELGGTCVAGPTAHGGDVHVRIPLVRA